MDTALKELAVHSGLEEEYLYPELRKTQDPAMIARAKEEHHVVELLIRELDGLDDGEQLEAKFSVLRENVNHHIEEEESKILPEAERLVDVQEMGRQMADRKQELESAMQGPLASLIGKAMRKKIATGG